MCFSCNNPKPGRITLQENFNFFEVPRKMGFLDSVFVLALIIFFSRVNSDEYCPYTRSPVGLENLTSYELHLVFYLNSTLAAKNLPAPARSAAKSYIQDFSDTVKNLRGYSGSNEKRIKSIISNPLATFRMTRRLTFDLPDVLFLIKDAPGLPTDLTDNLTFKDVNDAIEGILRIMHVYGLNAAAVVEGVFAGVHTGVKLKAIHCYEIGLQAIPNQFYDLAIDWLEQALKRISEGDKSIPRILVRATYDEAVDQHDKIFAKPPQKRFLHLFDRPVDPIRNQPRQMALRKNMRDIYIEHFAGDPDYKHNYINFCYLCTVGNYQTFEEMAELYCWYESSRHPYWTVGPLKMEMLAKDPDVLQIYDIIGEERTAILKGLVRSNLEQSKVADTSNDTAGASKVSNIRTSVQAWVNETQHPRIWSLMGVIEMATGLHVMKETSGDKTQIASYTFGGHYEVHIDALSNDKQYGPQKGNRIATFMIYLEEPELGGYTAFTHAGTRALPIKGSAVFWYDTLNDEAFDYRSYHGACPVILGQKWVANKWIRYKDQFVSRKCGLTIHEPFAIFQNNTQRTTLKTV